MHLACHEGQLQTVRWLYKQGAALDARCDDDRIPMDCVQQAPRDDELRRCLQALRNWLTLRVKFTLDRLRHWWASRAWAPGKGVERELQAKWAKLSC